ncbi:hypothetical protein GCM10025789_08920 [Tessaracoccus lubricantis]|uniref:DUF559 domain-containing protein n=1 Tax=Tessaracoccus lubricantis TaxID=545543 RepID=A0ABP9F5F3_9ACTN
MDANIFTLDDLHAMGLRRADIEDRLADGKLIRLRRGWYAADGANANVVAALRTGAHLGCLSGCEAHGLWVPKHQGIHAAYGRGTTPRSKTGLILHPYKAKQPGSAIWPVEDCLAQVIERHDVETILVVVESGVDKKLITQDMAEAMVKSTPHGDLRRWLGVARSGSETRVRLFFQRRNVPVRPLVNVPGVGEVDLLVGDHLLFECDSRRFHGSPEQQEVDSVRDLNAGMADYRYIRLTTKQIWTGWDETQVGLSAVLRKRRHIHRVRPSTAKTEAGRARARLLAEQLAQRRRVHSIGMDEDLADVL